MFQWNSYHQIKNREKGRPIDKVIIAQSKLDNITRQLVNSVFLRIFLLSLTCDLLAGFSCNSLNFTSCQGSVPGHLLANLAWPVMHFTPFYSKQPYSHFAESDNAWKHFFHQLHLQSSYSHFWPTCSTKLNWPNLCLHCWLTGQNQKVLIELLPNWFST